MSCISVQLFNCYAKRYGIPAIMGMMLVFLAVLGKTAIADTSSAQVRVLDQALFNDVQTDYPPPGSIPGWQKVKLVDYWYESHRNRASPAWYRMEFNVEQAAGLWGIYLPAVNTNAEIWLNGEFLDDGGRMQDPAARNWHRPLYFKIPGALLMSGRNVLDVRFLPKKSGFGYLSPIQVGPDTLLEPVYERALFFKQTLIGASTILLFGFGVFISLLWFKRRQDSLYGWFAAASFSWAFFVFDMYVRHVPVHERLWDTLVFACVGWLVIFMSIFFFRFWNLRYPRYERFLIIFGVVGSIGLYLVGDEHFHFVSSFIWDNVLIIFSMYMSWFIITQCMKWPSTEAWLLALALCVVVGFGAHDDLMQMGLLDPETGHLLPYGAPFLLGVALWMLVQRFVRALDEAEYLNRELDARVQLKTRQLEEKFNQIKVIEREKVLAQERERIMRDMHDGTGGHLVAALAQVDKGDMDKAVLGNTLRHALDDIRLMIDSLDPVDGDVVTVLAMLRSRMEQRLQYSGIKVQWNIQDVPGLPWLGPEKVLQLMHILYEAVANVIKHADANTIIFRTGVEHNGDDTQSIFIEIEDDGRGLDDHVKDGRGTANMYFRAAAMEARLQMDNGENGARIRIILPLT